jgi:signal transduction histidine kinase/ActR/RegA family two-component response regulator
MSVVSMVPSPEGESASATSATSRSESSGGHALSAVTVLVIAATVAAMAYEVMPFLMRLLDGYRFDAPYAVPAMDAPFAILAIGVGYLCLERHRLRNDVQSAALGNMLWLAALLTIAHILAQPDNSLTAGALTPMAPYLFLSSYLAVFLGIGLATHGGDRPFPLSDRGRLWLGAFALGVASLVVVGALLAQPLLAGSTTPGRLTSLEISLYAATSGSAVLWAFFGARRNQRSGADAPFSSALLLAVAIWLVGFVGLLILPVRYGIPWYMAALARPLGVAVIFVGLLREQVFLYREARARQVDLETLQVEMQANLRQLQETQGQLLQADKLKALGTLVSSMAHELNNPLTTILMSAQFLQRDDTISEKVRQRLEVMETESARAAHIIRDLLLFARRRDAERKQVDFADVLEATLALQASEFELHGIRVVRQIEPGLAPICADPHQLQQVFLNLFTNAIHAMYSAHGHGTLTVRLRQQQNELCLEIDDDGPGISAEHFGRIFDPFFTTKPVGEGTGLGLSLSLGIVEAHAGRMRAENLIGGGARITVRLPVDETRHVVEVPAASKAQGDTRGRVLIVDDNASVRNAIGDVLATIGHEVTVAARSKEATEHLVWQGFDVVMVDLRLPELDGRRIWEWVVRERPVLTSRVLFMTGDMLSSEIEQFVNGTGRPVLAKPVTVAQVRAAVQAVLTTRPSASSKLASAPASR